MTENPDCRAAGGYPCPCGEPATTTVEVEWADAKRRYRYCEECAEGIVFSIEGAEVLP